MKQIRLLTLADSSRSPPPSGGHAGEAHRRWQFSDGTLDFGTSDAPMKDSAIAASDSDRSREIRP